MKKAIYLIAILFCHTAFGQSFSVFDVDASNFPIVKAKFWAFDSNGDQITNFSTSDFEVTEDGVQRDVLSVYCPPYEPKALSSVLVMDASGSMGGGNLGLAKEAARAWIEGLLGESECAITAFNTSNYFVQDFTTDKSLLKQRANSLFAGGGTDYNAAFLYQMAGGIPTAKKGNYKRVVVFLSDGMPNFEPETQEIIRQAKANSIIVYAVTLWMSCPQSLKNISNQTGGQWFENVTTVEQARQIYQTILQTAQGGEPCEIEWESEVNCEAERNCEMTCLPLAKSENFSYDVEKENIARLEVDPICISFGGVEPGKSKKMFVTFTALNKAFNIINIKSTNSSFSVSKKSFSLSEGESDTVEITFSPIDSTDAFSNFLIESEPCNNYLYAFGGFPPMQNTLKLTHPNGGEKFIVGTDTIITWEGIPQKDTVLLEYSIDDGNTWENVSNNATDLSYNWKNIPLPTSNECLMKVKQKISIDTVLTLYGHNGGVQSVSWSPDGTKIASGSEYGKIKIWNFMTSSCINTLSQKDFVYSVSWSPDGTKIASGSWDKTVKIWNPSSGDIISTLSGHHFGIYCISWSPDGTKIASGSADQIVMIWNANTGICIDKLFGHRNSVKSVTWSPDGSQIASGSIDETIKIWNFSTGKCIDTLIGHHTSIQSVAWSPDGSQIASGSGDYTIKIWNLTTGECIRTLSGHSGQVNTIAWSPDGSQIASGSGDYTIKIWNLTTGECIRTLFGHNDEVRSISWNPDGTSIVSGSLDKTVKVWNLNWNKGQEDVSDSLWSIVAPEIQAIDVDMGKVIVSDIKDSVVKAFLTNTGSYSCRVDSIFIEGEDANQFNIISGIPPFAIPADGEKAVEFSFYPTSVGVKNASIVIFTQADTLRQSITGEGIQPSLAVLENLIDFGIVEVGNIKDSLQAITIKNIGSAPLQINSTKLNKINDVDFSTLAGGGAFILNPGDTCKMDLRFEPGNIGRKSGILEFYYNDIGSPAIVQLYGEGILTASALAVIQADSAKAYPGDEIEIPIILKNKESIQSSGATSLKTDLLYNPTLLWALDYQKQNIDETTAKITLGNLPVGINEGEPLTNVRFKVGLGNAEECDLTLSNAEAVGGTADITTINGHFRLLGICREGGDRLINPNDRVQLNISPNPSEELIKVKFNLIEKGKTEIKLVNMLGKTMKLKTYKNSRLGLGEAVFETSALPQGVYYIILRTPTEVYSRAVEILK